MNQQKNGIGMLIFQLREQENITEEELSAGLCSLGEFRKIEMEGKVIEKTLLDALLGRMGRAADNFSIVLEKEQYRLYELQNQIREAYFIKDFKLWEKRMEELKEKISEENRCDYQFYCKMKFLVDMYFGKDLNKNFSEMEKELIEIIKITIPQFVIERVFEYYLCSEEIGLCCVLAALYLKYEERNKAKLLLENLIACIEKRYKGTEEKVRVYPQVAMLLFQTYDVKIENQKWVSLCKNTIDLLAENGVLIWMEKLLQYYKIGLEEKVERGQRKFTKLEELIYQNVSCGLDSIKELNLEYGIFYDVREIVVLQNEYDEVYLLQEMILDYRKRTNKRQSQLGEAIGVEPETVSRYERGKKKPSWKKYQILAEEIGMPQDRYGVCLPVENYILYERIRQVERFLFRQEAVNAEQLYLEIEPLIPKERPENKQYCMRTKALLDYFLHGLTGEEKLYRLETAICFTFPAYCVESDDFLKSHIPNRYEAVLLNNIGACYAELNQKETANRIFRAVLNAYKESEIREEYHLATVTLTRVNYIKCLGMLGNYNEALEEIEKALRMNLQFGKGNMMPYLLYAKGWTLWKKEGSFLTEEKRNACMKYYRQAYWISGLMNNFILQQKLEELYKKDFDVELI